MLRVGVVSDTHGLLRPEAMVCLRGTDFIVHARDIGTAGVLEEIGTLAPVTAVRCNNDKGSGRTGLGNRSPSRRGCLHIRLA